MPAWVGEVLPFVNLLLFPALGYVMRMERRIFTLETVLAVKLENLPCAQKGVCVHQG